MWKVYFFIVIITFLLTYGCENHSGIEEYNKGINYQENNHTALAEQQYKLAIKKNPNLAEAYLNLGLIYIEDGWLEGGEKMTLKSISLFKSSNKTIITGNTLEQSLSIAYNNLGVIEIQRAIEYEIDYNYLLSKSHWEKGMEYFYVAVNLDATNSKAQSNIKRFSDAY